MNTGQQCADDVGIQLGRELGLHGTGRGDAGAESTRMSPADVIYRLATVMAVLYLLVSVF